MSGSLQERKDEKVGWNYHLNRNNILNKAIMESSRSPHTDKNSTSYRLNVFKSMSDLPIRESHHKPKTCAKINSPIKTYLINRICAKLVL